MNGLARGEFLLFLLHHGLNWKWLRGLGRGRYTAFRVLQTILAALLLFCMLGVMASGILLSRHLFAALPIPGGRSWARVVHMLCAYWGFVLMSLHLGLHWGMVSGAVKRKFPSVGKSMMRGAAVLTAAYDCFLIRTL